MMELSINSSSQEEDPTTIIDNRDDIEAYDDPPTTTGHVDADERNMEEDDEKQPPLSLFERAWAVWQWYCCLNDDDNFVQILRKMSISVHLPCSPVPLALSLYFFSIGFLGFGEANDVETNYHQLKEDGTSDDGLLGVRIASVFCFTYFLNLLIPYIYLRINRHLTTNTMDVIIIVELLNAFLVTVCIPQWSSRSVAICISIICILGQTEFVLFECMASFVLYCVDGYNNAYSQPGAKDEAILLLIPGFRNAPPWEEAIYAFAMAIVMIFVISGVYFQSIAHIRHVESSKQAVEMTRRVVHLLRRYDTDAVPSALKEFSDNVDPDLLESLQAMTLNLETYKPFLPNYVFHEDDDDDDDSAQRSDAYDSDSEGSLSTGSRQSVRHSDTSSITSRSSSRSINKHQNHHNNTSTTNLSNSAHQSKDTLFEGRVTIALLECPTSNGSGSHGLRTASHFVDAIHVAADLTKASVHSLFGDVAMISWNATHRVPQPEMKATKFINTVKKALLKQNNTSNNCSPGLSGVVFTGPASSFSVTSSKKQHASMIAAPWMPMATAALDLARDHGTILLCETTARVSSCNYDLVAVDRVLLASPHQSAVKRPPKPLLLLNQRSQRNVQHPSHSFVEFDRSAVLYELVGEVHHDEHSEWMYQLEEKRKTDAEKTMETLSDAIVDVLDLLTQMTQDGMAGGAGGSSLIDLKQKLHQEADAALQLCTLLEEQTAAERRDKTKEQHHLTSLNSPKRSIQQKLNSINSFARQLQTTSQSSFEEVLPHNPTSPATTPKNNTLKTSGHGDCCGGNLTPLLQTVRAAMTELMGEC